MIQDSMIRYQKKITQFSDNVHIQIYTYEEIHSDNGIEIEEG